MMKDLLILLSQYQMKVRAFVQDTQHVPQLLLQVWLVQRINEGNNHVRMHVRCIVTVRKKVLIMVSMKMNVQLK